MGRVKRIEDIVFTLLLLLFFGVVLLGIDTWIGAFKPTQAFETGPKYFPVALASAALVLLVCVLVGQILESRSTAGIDQADEAKETVVPLLKQRVLLATLLSLLIFIQAMEYVGFLVASLFLLLALQYILGNRSFVKIVLFALGMIAVNYLIFIRLLYIQLPKGVGMFQKFSDLLY